jgi:hypothetical protein
MRTFAAIVIAFVLTACYTDRDAERKLREMGRPEPIACNYLDSRAQSWACVDGAGANWICSDQFGCTRWGSK